MGRGGLIWLSAAPPCLLPRNRASVEMTSIRLFFREYAKEVGEHP